MRSPQRSKQGTPTLADERRALVKPRFRKYPELHRRTWPCLRFKGACRYPHGSSAPGFSAHTNHPRLGSRVIDSSSRTGVYRNTTRLFRNWAGVSCLPCACLVRPRHPAFRLRACRDGRSPCDWCTPYGDTSVKIRFQSNETSGSFSRVLRTAFFLPGKPKLVSPAFSFERGLK